MEGNIARISDIPEEQPRIGVYVCHCGLNIAQTVDCQKVTESVLCRNRIRNVSAFRI